MRTFEKYLNRRNIKDAKSYFMNKNIQTDEQLSVWCNNNNIEIPLESFFDVEPPSVPQHQAKTTKGPALTSAGEEEIWHTPAADRPLRKPAKKLASTKASPKRKVSK